MFTKHLTIKYHSELERPVSWVALVGFMGSGKSRIGAELSRKLHLNFIDTDRVIERVSCMHIPDIFELYGETTFRDYESEIVRRSCRLDDAIISTGGGTVVRSKNREALKNRGPVVLLTASAETTFQRTRRHKRPLLEVGNPIERINDLMAARKGFYEDVASVTVSTDGRPSFEVVDEIIEKLYEWQQEQEQLKMLQNAETAEVMQQPEVMQKQVVQGRVVQQRVVQGQVLQQQGSYQHIVKIQTQQITVEEHSLNNEQASETKFSDEFLTSDQDGCGAELPSTESVSVDRVDTKSESVGVSKEALKNHQESHDLQSSNSTNSGKNGDDYIDEYEEKTEDKREDAVGRDIYAEMIRDLMRDPRA